MKSLIWEKTWPGVVLALFTLYFFTKALAPFEPSLISAFNLLMHEAGHWIFALFGQFVGILGGSLLQVLVPLVFAFGFYVQNIREGSSIQTSLGMAFCLMWAGHNVTEVAHYVADAEKMILPLIGGNGAIHDWNWLLTATGLLEYTSIIANALRALGFMVLIGGFGWGAYQLAKLTPPPQREAI